MSFRRKLLIVFAFTVILCVAAVTWIVSVATRRAFDISNDERSAALVAQFQHEFDRRGEEIASKVEKIAQSEAVIRMALAVSRAAPDYGAYLNEARTMAESQQLDFLELLDVQGTIISSAQWPAKFGYKENLASAPIPRAAFLRQEELPDGAALSLSVMRKVDAGEKPFYVIGGKRLDKEFLLTLQLPAGTRVLFYQNLGDAFSPQSLIDPSGSVRQTDELSRLVRQVQQRKEEASAIVHWSSDPAGEETFHALPLSGQENQLLGILLVGSSRRPYVELRQHIRSAALVAAAVGIVLAIVFSSWAAARVTRPVEQLADAAREVAAGNWYAQAPVTSSDELGELAETFNRMTRDLLEHKERLVQTERVAAWRELARRLAHELKNPLFPLQLTVENLLRAREQSPEQFEEIFQESSATLLAEIANLKTIISRFSEFSKMPQPQWQRVDLNDVVRNAVRLFQAQLQSPGKPSIECNLQLEASGTVAADPELLHRAVSNLVLNAMDAMPQGGTLTLRTHGEGDRVWLEVSDTGAGLTPEECQRLFTPYYTSKTHGTGLGLAIVQSVVTDHNGKISVRSEKGKGTTFVIEIARNTEKLQ